MGEKLLTERDRRPVPAHHNRVAWLLASLSTAFALVMAWGLYHLSAPLAAAGTAGAVAAKFWFLDRMTWLYEDMATRPPERPDSPERGSDSPQTPSDSPERPPDSPPNAANSP
jgi:hypothetical protein